MKSNELFLLITTCLIGFAGGIYAYYVGYAPMATIVDSQLGDWQGELIIVGEAYGSCSEQAVCPTFRVDTDGNYRFFYFEAESIGATLREGTIARTELLALRNAATVTALQSNSQPTQPTLCESQAGGIDVRYTITRDGTDYILDSCGTNIQTDGPLWQKLSEVWRKFVSGSQ